MRLTVVKVGGSLFDLPDLRRRLPAWLDTLGSDSIVLVPGGGSAADAVRDLDARHGLGEEVAHGLALRAMTLNAWFLAAILPGVVVTAERQQLRRPGRWLLDASTFVAQDEDANALPASWQATSDSVAARAARVLDADALVLLKSVDVPTGIDWAEAARRGWVDPVFPSLVRGWRGVVRTVNLRGV